MIKQDIPKGYVRSPLNVRDCGFAKISYKVIITGWIWRNLHANPIETVIIKQEDLVKAQLIADYYKRLKLGNVVRRMLDEAGQVILELVTIKQG